MLHITTNEIKGTTARKFNKSYFPANIVNEMDQGTDLLSFLDMNLKKKNIPGLKKNPAYFSLRICTLSYICIQRSSQRSGLKIV